MHQTSTTTEPIRRHARNVGDDAHKHVPRKTATERRIDRRSSREALSQYKGVIR